MSGLGLIKDASKHIPVRNFPEFGTIDPEYDARYHEVKEWIAGRKCIYLQGINSPARASAEVITAVMETPDVCAIILGSADREAMDAAVAKYGEQEVHSKICVAGMFPVLKVPQYMKLCHASLVFYKKTSPNNWYCEANRLYQAVDMGLPVVVGANPSMKSTVEELGVGVSVDTDGSDPELIKKGLAEVLEKHDIFVDNIGKLGDEIHWDNQEELLKNTFSELFN